MHDRTYRFIIPPSLLIFYLAAAATLNEHSGTPFFKAAFEKVLGFVTPGTPSEGNGSAAFVGAVFASGVILLTAGILISTATTCALHLGQRLGFQIYETIVLDNDSIDRFFSRIGVDAPRGSFPNVQLTASHLFIHGACNDRLEAFLDRRWNTFLTSCNCAAAGLIAAIIAVYYQIYASPGWWIVILLLSAAFLYLGWQARSDIFDACRVAGASRGLLDIQQDRQDS